nr:reverse transcriptase domain-containing protein [Tanacetum cinerariifolium]
MPNNVKTYDGSDDPKDHLKIFQEAAKVECWAMPTWWHMFNSTLTGSARVWFDDLPSESIENYDDLIKAFLANFLQQKKCIKDPVEIHHIKQREGESMKDFVQRFKAESRHVKGAPKCMRISRFLHGITNPELIKRMHDNIPKSMDEMMRVTTTFLRGEVAASNKARKKTLLAWRQEEAGRKQNFDRRGDFRNQKIKELIKSGKLSHVIKELKQGSRKNQLKAAKKGETSGKDKPLAILMVHPWQRVARQRITQCFSPDLEILFSPFGEEDETKGPMIIEAEIGGHSVHRIYVDGGSTPEILYEHCFNRLCPEVKNQMVQATAPLFLV